ncbi:hypothetical protein M636_17395 [Vibrio parahaemolyticus O1:K33 str. CDC_K4557]|nr:hypothetical protein M636_17395 [Vibrio parahaemolyticus O1:K33 str. CDC_K4557]
MLYAKSEELLQKKNGAAKKLLHRHMYGVPSRIRTYDHMLSLPLQFSLPP